MSFQRVETVQTSVETNPMTDRSSPNAPSRHGSSDLPLTVGLVAVVLFFVAAGIASYTNVSALRREVEHVAHTHEVIASLQELLSLLKDAETGQRGFLLTGDEKYLSPYTTALKRIDERFAEIQRLTLDNPGQQGRLPTLKDQIQLKLDELEETIDLRRTKGFEAARAVVVTDRGMAAMETIRQKVDALEQEEFSLRARRLEAMDGAYRTAVVSGALVCFLGVMLSAAVGYLVRRSVATRKRQAWLLGGQNGLSAAMLGDRRIDDLGNGALKFLAEYLGAHAAAFFATNGGRYGLVATYGVPEGGVPDGFNAGDGLLGQAAQDRRTFVLRDVPEGYLTVGSALGRGRPRHLVVATASSNQTVNGVLELGFFNPVGDDVTELLERVSESLGSAVRSAYYRAHLQNLVEETQRQSEELQAQQEELRVSNEELEEQGRTLKASQSRLELQQTELEQTNTQLEEQAQHLETQRDDLARANSAIEEKAVELEQASRYKSDFLANMSHELRTPLNSSLILAKLLADNPAGNLTDEQVRFAETIQSSGNDLLNLINDILDLSKIEAGKLDVRPGPVLISSLVKGLVQTFEPLADEKGLRLATRIDPSCFDTIETDQQRLEQVLKNLLSNALKFTEKGEVRLDISATDSGRIAFAVADTGIGIPKHQQKMVFEAFRQADGTTSRKHGGTGLGLSISRDLARLLGGSIAIVSEPDRGSTFTLVLPQTYSPAFIRAESSPSTPARDFVAEPRVSPRPTTVPRSGGAIVDDREKLDGSRRVILVVEDDEAFARILFDLAHELRFQCLVATTAEEGLALAIQHGPTAVILDIGLPDHSGLTVLDRLKHDARTRHLPVHVITAGDYARTALSLGAAEFMLKPVKREDLVQALGRLETRLSQRLRRVLVVEDDPVQQDGLRRLLASHDVEAVGVGTAGECLERLRSETFDCMVLDLSLPDATGHSLLETLSREDAYSFPPVIVYTGRDMSADEEQQLRRYSKSIIIKGAKSPERLLDEVTLFLHQVEADLPAEQRRMLEKARSRDSVIEGRRILVVEDDVRNVFALTSILEPRGAKVGIARNGREALAALEKSQANPATAIDLVLMDIMMPEMDGLTATRKIRSRPDWQRLPVIMLTAKAMKDDQEECIAAGANDYIAKPLDVEKLLSLVRVWMPR
jgi:signal transduction histidine kinase/DNA-binding response OmpR family regulator/CHASE3 domain sensor protein